MQNGKFWQLYQSLTSLEIKRIEKYLHQNGSYPSTVVFWQCIQKKKNSILLSKENIFALVYPLCTEYKEQAINELLSDAYQCIRFFLVLEKQQQNNYSQRLSYIAILHEREAYTLAHQELALLERTLDKQNTTTMTGFLELKWKVEQWKQKLYYDKQRTEDTNLQQCSNALDMWYLKEKLNLLATIQSHEALFSKKYAIPFRQEVIDMVLEKKYPFTAFLQTNVYLIQLSSSEAFFTLEDYLIIRKTIEQDFFQFNATEQLSAWNTLLNYCIKQYNKGETNYVTEIFYLYDTGVSQTYLLENSVLSKFAYTNVTALALRLGNFEKAKERLENWKKHLSTTDQEAYYSFNTGKYYFEKKEYKRAIKLLTNQDYSDDFLQMASRTILIKMYYEQADTDSLEYALQNFKMFLRRQKIKGYHLINYQNFIQFTTKLYKQPWCNSKEWAAFYQAIEAIQPLTEKAWILKQLQILKT